MAAGVIIGWKGDAPGWSVTAVLALLGVLAIVFAFLISAVINRHLAWQRAFIDGVKKIEGPDPKLFRKGMIDDDEGTRVVDFFNTIRWILCVFLIRLRLRPTKPCSWRR